jgi:L-ascorbate metabolism protein UlaG (beta-lactamase superfamily)
MLLYYYMKIKKIGHCCLVIETKGIKIMTDPGNYTNLQNEELDIDLILITHEHKDHLHIESLKEVIKNNPNVSIFTNNSAAKILKEENIGYSILIDGESTLFNNVSLAAFGNKHAEIFDGILQVENTGYFIDDRLFYGGDSFYIPNKKVEILALPVSGPWVCIKDTINYAIKISPKYCFPVHDGMIMEDKIEPTRRIPETILNKFDISFLRMESGDSLTF